MSGTSGNVSLTSGTGMIPSSNASYSMQSYLGSRTPELPGRLISGRPDISLDEKQARVNALANMVACSNTTPSSVSKS